MAILLTATTTATVVLLLFSLLAHPISADIVSELSALRSKSPNGVIHLTDALLRRIISLPTPRPFHFIVFFDAQQLHVKSELNLKTLKSEFSLVSSSYHSNNSQNHDTYTTPTLLFFDIEFLESQASFQLFGITALPHIRLVPPSATDLKTDSIPMETSDYSGLADSMSRFIESKAKIKIGPIIRPPLVSRNQIALMGVVVLVSAPFFVKKLVSGNTILHDRKVWMAGAILVYFFSVSGAMFNIIRKMPMFLLDNEDPDKLVFFYKGSGMQLGAEGFAVGGLYTVVGLLMAFVTHMLVRVENRNTQKLLMVVVLFVSFWAVKMVMSLSNWKTGYMSHAYWPTSWQ